MAFRSLWALLATTLILGLAADAPAQSRAARKARSAAQKASAAQTNAKSNENAAPADEGAGKASGEADKATSKTDSEKDKTKDEEKGKDAPGKPTGKLEKATFGGGCFWCMEAVFERIPGVRNVVSGYAGGTVPYPSYELVCTGVTGHAEVIQVSYDPGLVSYEKLLKYFFAAHDPTTLNAQGPDFGTQYRSIILYHDTKQRDAALAMYKALTKAKIFRNRIVTELVPYMAFFPADEHHQDYFRRNRAADYCQMIIAPKLRKISKLKIK